MSTSAPDAPVWVYRGRLARQLLIALAVIIFALMASIFAPDDGILAQASGTFEAVFYATVTVAMMAFFVWAAGYRALRAGLFVSADGILVRNVFRTFSVRWPDVQRFELARLWLSPMVGYVVLRDGTRQNISVIFGSAWEGLRVTREARETIDQLNRFAASAREAGGQLPAVQEQAGPDEPI